MDFGVILGIGLALAQVGLILFVLVGVLGARSESDPDAERAAGIYYNGVLFVTVFAVLFAAFAVVSSLLNLTVDKPSADFFGGGNGHDGDWDAGVRALIVGLVAAGVYRVHDQRRGRRPWGAPGHRLRRTFLYSITFVAILVATFAAVATLFALWQVIAPGVTGSGPRSESWITFFSALFLAAFASAIAWWHLREAEPDVAMPGRPTAPIIPPEPVPAPPPVDMETGTRTRAPARKATVAKKATKRA